MMFPGEHVSRADHPRTLIMLGWHAAQLQPSGFKPEGIDVVVLNHGHLDHVASIIENGTPLCPNARYVICATRNTIYV